MKLSSMINSIFVILLVSNSAMAFTTHCNISNGKAYGMFCSEGTESIVAQEGTLTQFRADGTEADTYSTKVSKTVTNTCEAAIEIEAKPDAIACTFSIEGFDDLSEVLEF